MVFIRLDQQMLLSELYELRAKITDIVVDADETQEARLKIDQIISLVGNAPSDDNGSGFPRISIRGR